MQFERWSPRVPNGYLKEVIQPILRKRSPNENGENKKTLKNVEDQETEAKEEETEETEDSKVPPIRERCIGEDQENPQSHECYHQSEGCLQTLQNDEADSNEGEESSSSREERSCLYNSVSGLHQGLCR